MPDELPDDIPLHVSLDGRQPKKRQALWVLFTGREFDGLLQSGPSKGMSDLGPRRWWEICLLLEARKGVLPPRRDPAYPEGSQFDIPPTIG